MDNGDIIAIPTETVYGLAVDAFNENSFEKIYVLKNRSKHKPLTLFCNSIEQIGEFCIDIPDEFYKIADALLPGPLSIILKKKEGILSSISCGLETIAVRIPDNEFCSELLEQYGKPLATTSANISQQKSLVYSNDVHKVFQEKIPLIVDGGKCEFSEESIIVSLASQKPKIIRAGTIYLEKIKEILNISD